MGEIQLLGMTHFPPFAWRDDVMAGIMGMMLSDPGVPEHEKDPASWPPEMRAEWGDDRGATSAPAHRAALAAGFDRVRAAIEGFAPDALLVIGDDQYENFREDIIPPISILAFPDREVRPGQSYVAQMFPSYWDEPADRTITIKGRPDIARQLTAGLIDEGFEIAYAYRPLHDEHLAHAFLNTVLFLDHRREGFDWPVICMPVNCYGRKVIAARGLWKPFGEELELDPPSPTPRRLMDVGSAVVRQLRHTSWRVSVIASSSWSHAFLTDHTWRLRPDTAADRELYQAMVDGDFDRWERTSTGDIEHAGQQEVLNWFVVQGAARELGATPRWSEFIETWVFNSNKAFAIWDPQ